MRLIDVDAEIARIEEEIMKLTKAIVRWQARKFEESTLYDIDAKIQELQNNRTDCRVEIQTLRNYKTAFDVGKVLNELKHEESEALRRYSESKGTAYAFSDKCSCDNWAKAIEIVKRGGRDEDYWK